MRNLRFHHVDQPELICFSKRSQRDSDTVLVVVNLDPHTAHEATIWLDLPALGMDPGAQFVVSDELSGESYQWGQANYVRLDPALTSAHVFHRHAIPGHVTAHRPQEKQVATEPDRSPRRTPPPIAQPSGFAQPPGGHPDSFSSETPATRSGTSTRSSTRCWSAAFHDSNGDGTGDLRGLTARLDYLQWLGVDCLWLPPIYASPLRDGGYDISDFTNGAARVRHHRGLRRRWSDAAHTARHAGDRRPGHEPHLRRPHPWFQESRANPDGPYGDFYVWSDGDHGYPDARVIFVDTEHVELDLRPGPRPVLLAPVLLPPARPELRATRRSRTRCSTCCGSGWTWASTGSGWTRCPYLYERERHQLREPAARPTSTSSGSGKVVDDEYPDRVLLAEANQWPADVVEYFGDPGVGGDECHMAFHFPLMPRIFMAVRREQRYPISEILAQTPTIPSGCQWGIFLRNHDELTLEMVTDDERDYMYTEYAKDPRMKANIGIRRRLAPLLDNDRNQLELFTALLLSLPGSPVLYYGDEIGMGDNIWLGDRDGVRTPMQWTPDRNAGFSTADPRRLYLPTIMDPIYGYQAINVEAQQRNPGSLLHWTARMIEIRKRHPVFGLGGYEELSSSNPSVLAFVREHRVRDADAQDPGDRILCVNNLSRFPQPVELDLRRFRGITPIECMGGVIFPPIGELPYLLTLPGHGFYWFQLPEPRERPPAVSGATIPPRRAARENETGSPGQELLHGDADGRRDRVDPR